jgi:hypothetical protein
MAAVSKTTFEDYSDVGLTIETTLTGGRTDRKINIDVDLCRDDYGDILDVAAVSRDFRNAPAYKKLVEVVPDARLSDGIDYSIEKAFETVRELELQRMKEDAEELEAAMDRHHEQMMELCPDGDFSEYTAYIEKGDYVYILLKPMMYLRKRIDELI